MINRFKNIFFLLSVVLLLTLSGCFNNKNQSTRAIDITANNSKNLKHTTKITTVYLLRDSLILYLNNCKIVSINKQGHTPFHKLKYNKVIAYDYDGVDGENVFSIVENNKLVTKIKQQRQLNQKQVNDLTNWLGDTSTYGGAYAFCFEPQLGIVFYYNNKITAYISVSLGCNFLDSSVPIPATKEKSISIDKDYKYPAKGFSKIGSLRLMSLAKTLNLRIQ